MKAKTIRAVLRKKTDQWINSIEDIGLQSAVRDDAYVTGGSIASMLLREPVNDYDIYFKTYDTALAVAHYYVAQFISEHPGGGITVQAMDGRIKIIVPSDGVAGTDPDPEVASDGRMVEAELDPPPKIHVEDKAEEPLEPYRPVFLSANAITLSDKVQLVLRFYGDPNTVHKNYDFVHCTNYWDVKSGALTLHPEALEMLLARELRYVGSKYPLCSIIRTRKFIQRGWSINAGQYLKMAFQLSELDLHDVAVLEEQLTGVDLVYFQSLLSAIREAGAEDKLSAGYVATLVDRMF